MVSKKSDELYFEPFYKDCCFFQCNPLFNECFKTTSENNSSFSENEIIKMFCNKIRILKSSNEKNDDIFKKMKICYVGILNVSKENNDPEFYPNIGYSRLQILFERMKNLDFLNANDENYKKLNVELFKVLNELRIYFGLEIYNSKEDGTITDTEIINELNDLKRNPNQDLSYIYYNGKEKIKTLNDQIITDVDECSKNILNNADIEDKKHFVEELLKKLYDYNSINQIGTLLYLNSMVY